MAAQHSATISPIRVSTIRPSCTRAKLRQLPQVLMVMKYHPAERSSHPERRMDRRSGRALKGMANDAAEEHHQRIDSARHLSTRMRSMSGVSFVPHTVRRSVQMAAMVPIAPRMASPAPGTASHSKASLAAPVLPSPGAANPATNQNVG